MGTTRSTAITEEISEMSTNRTLFAEKFTSDSPVRPEVVHGLQRMEDVFEYYQPEVDVIFEEAEGFLRRETIRFRSVEDFSAKKMMEQCSFLKQVASRQQEYLKLAHLAALDTELTQTLSNNEARNALLNWIESAIKEIKNIK